MMNNDWLEFTEATYERRHAKPRVLLTVEKRFRLNGKALDLLGKPAAVRFLFDVGGSRIGIRTEDPDKEHAFRVRPNTKGRTALVNASVFCKRFGIKPETTIEFVDVRLDGDGTMILDLNTTKRA